MVKVVGIAVCRTGTDLNEPIPLCVANDLSSFGFFQKQVRNVALRYVTSRHVTGLLELGFLMFRVDDDSNANGLILLCIFFLSLHYADIFLPRRVSKKCSIS